MLMSDIHPEQRHYPATSHATARATMLSRREASRTISTLPLTTPCRARVAVILTSVVLSLGGDFAVIILSASSNWHSSARSRSHDIAGQNFNSVTTGCRERFQPGSGWSRFPSLQIG